jgi:ribosomal protein L31
MLATVAAACKHDILPESGTYAARLYVERCGQCHPAYNPHQMTAAMWQAQVDAMQPRIQQAGLVPLTADERAAILDYLTRNAGSQ